jgi:hypothetical protein
MLPRTLFIKMMKTKYLILGLFSALCVSCALFDPPRHYTNVDVLNESEQDVYFYLALGKGAYPDTTLSFGRERVDGIKKPGRGGTYDFGPRHEEFFAALPKDTLSIYVFSVDTLAKYSWEQVQDDYNILARYDFSLQDMEDLDFDVVYPPNVAMSHMKMYLPCGNK